MLHPSPETTSSHGPALIGAKRKMSAFLDGIFFEPPGCPLTDCLKKPANKHLIFLQ